MSGATATLVDVATLAFLIAHGADADLDAREIGALEKHIASLAALLALDADVTDVLRRASDAYLDLAVADADALLGRLGRALDARQRRDVYAAFVEVAAADGSIQAMEQTFLRHIAAAWQLG